ncbi:MAG TPA: selenocysteine-specific translation elongation factor [Acidimicrobiia bacterium]|jgi:selenocysteine-specific elongation factor|nr:selenocysteine-specific translation elongation factor [Acidimicrobiia bacterium]
MPIIATAGHVDHGKSTLVRALTGRDPDRWQEEKDRGLTIDLGFAWTDIDGVGVGFVDVPGHERFIKNMLAGVGGLDVALLVVAADEGWMPQTEEHVAVLDALAVKHGVVALTRTDLVDPELVELASAEVLEYTAGTSLETWPIVPVSAPNGAGITELRSTLGRVLGAAGEPPDVGLARLWVDRAFVIGGAGLVVTGTLLDGALRIGDDVQVWPDGAVARIRSLQTHEAAVDEIGPGNRAAVNVVGLDRTDVPRGTMLAAPHAFRTTRRLLVDLSPVRAWPGAVTDRGAYHLHAGSGHWPVRIRLVGARRLDTTGPALLTVETRVPLRMGDRFVVREVGRRVVVAGGIVLDPSPETGALDPKAVALLREALDGDRNAWADALLAVRGTDDVVALAADTGGGMPTTALETTGVAMTQAWASTRLAEISASVTAFHDDNPLRPGAPKATLASRHGVSVAVLDALVMSDGSGLVGEADTVRLASFSPKWPAALEVAWAEAQARLQSDGLAVPRTSTLGLEDDWLHAVIRRERLVVIGPDVAYLPEQIDEILRRLDELGDGFTVSEFRDAMGVSRRHAVPLLEWLDSQGWTSRRGDVRTLRRRPTPRRGGAPTR